MPFYVETFASFSWFGPGTPLAAENSSKYPDGNYELIINGNAGNDFVTVTGGGDIADAGETKKWGCVIKYDDGTYESYLVKGTDTSNKVFIYPNLKRNVSSGLLASVQDEKLGQHLTKEGSKAWIEHIYKTPLEHYIKEKYIDQHRGDTSSDTNRWKSVGFTSGTMTDGTFMATHWNNAGNISSGSDSYYVSNSTRTLTIAQERSSSEDIRYLEWEVELKRESGYLETFIGCLKGSVLVEFFLDGKVVKSEVISGKVERLCFDFLRAEKGKIKITFNTLNPTEVRIGTTTWWINSKYSGQLIKPFQKVVYIGDSWGTRHRNSENSMAGIVPDYLKELMSNDLGDQANVIGLSKGGMTTNWALDWFHEYVAKEKPDIVIFEYFTNDAKGSDKPYEKPDGTIGQTVLDTTERTRMEQWILQYKLLANKAIELGIQPILIMPTSTGAIDQSQTHGNWSEALEYGYTTTN